MSYSGTSAITFLAFGLLSVAALTGQEQRAGDPPRFRVSVDVVRIDAVVTDRDGRIVGDLTADDFEVFQDGKPQKVTFAQFVPVIIAPTTSETPPASRANAGVPSLPPALANRDAIQRSLAVVVDDLGMSWEGLHYAKRALHAFVDRALQPTDLVAIVRTGGSLGGLQPFTTDRRVLRTTIDRLQWNALSRSGVEAFQALNVWTTFDDRHGMGDPDDFTLVDSFRSSMLATGTLGALNLAIQAARDLPGRKAIIFVSEGFEMMQGNEPDFRVRRALDTAIDQAARAGVVIYSLDARGLQTAGLQASDNLKRPSSSDGTMETTVRDKSAERAAFNRDTQEALAYVAEQTGGFAILNTNDLARGLGRISEDVRDYYVIGYVPEDGTFAKKGQKPRHHKISVKVRRPGLRVRTRKEFLGISDPAEPPTLRSAAAQLIHTAISPFSATDIELRATALPGYSLEEGTFVRALLHIDARALTFDDDGGKKTASADVLGMAFDHDGTQVAHLSTGFSVALTNEAADEALREGLVYTLRIPIRRAGAYQVRFAVRDQRSGRLGSAGEFVEIPDIPRGEFALSGIVLQDDAGSRGNLAGEGGLALTPSQALRIYRRGAELSYAYEVYNAGREVQAVPSVWRGNDKILEVPPDTVVPPASREGRFAARGRLKLGDALAPGSYVLQVAAATPDQKRAGRLRTAVQRITFEVR